MRVLIQTGNVFQYFLCTHNEETHMNLVRWCLEVANFSGSELGSQLDRYYGTVVDLRLVGDPVIVSVSNISFLVAFYKPLKALYTLSCPANYLLPLIIKNDNKMQVAG